MIPIFQFSWHEFVLDQSPDATIGELYNLAQRASQFFVFHDPLHRLSALVLPGWVVQTVESLNLPYMETAAATGFLDLLRRDQMNVHMNQPASLVARLADSHEVPTVIVTNDDAVPVGLFFPSVVAERLTSTYLLEMSSQTLQDDVKALVTGQNLAAAMEAIEGEHEEFHSEAVNLNSPDPYVCHSNAGIHITSRCPCGDHPWAECRRELIASYD